MLLASYTHALNGVSSRVRIYLTITIIDFIVAVREISGQIAKSVIRAAQREVCLFLSKTPLIYGLMLHL